MRVKRLSLNLFWIFSLCFAFNMDAQTEFATIKRNENISAKSLLHELNETRDTLKLESSNYIHRIYTVGENQGMVDVVVNRKKYDLSLRELVKGKHVFVVQEFGKKIIFQVHINHDSWQDRSSKVGETYVRPVIKSISEDVSTFIKPNTPEPDGGNKKM